VLSFSCDGRFRVECARDREHADVVFLAESLGGLGDGLGGLIADGLGAFEAEEFALVVGGFDDGGTMTFLMSGYKSCWRKAKASSFLQS
jgi:hypothetical protein